ncbi:MAG TPA: pyrroline-5-carboxylate reductase dimerization domain-containing protein, partial [Tepidisphaeraceae bacterium]
TENQLDAVTALSGSGPAYVFYLLEHMTAAGVALGLSLEHADLLARQTVFGSATMAKQTAETPQSLRKKVTSPNGTTQAAIESFDGDQVGSLIQKGLRAARDRSIALGKSEN